MRRIAALLTSFNRKKKTLGCMAALHQQVLPADVRLTVFLTDDASPDGTAEAVREAFPDVVLLRGNGNLYWGGGMRRAFDEAMKTGFDFYLWVNDDTDLIPEALTCLLTTHDQLLARTGRSPVVVGSVQDPITGEWTYGGVIRTSRWRPLKFTRLGPKPIPQECETINGNCALIPRAVTRAIGNISAEFTHGMGDFDYGLRARRAGFSNWVAPGYLGTCSEDSVSTWADSRFPLPQRWKQMKHVKGLPPREWMIFARCHAGRLWPVFWASPYVRMFVLGLRHEGRPAARAA